jgi:N-acetylmuramoyl-L-alanine amidase CwlA
MGVPLIKDPIHNFDNRESYPMTPEYITIHNFGSDDIAEDVTEYVDNTSEVKSWHFTVGKDKIYQELPLNLNGWHASCGEYCDGNRKSIGIEIEENYQAMDNAAKLVAYLQLQNDYEIKTHQDWSGKYCPRWILDNYSIGYFKELVEGYKMKFKDVPTDKWSFEAIDFVSDLGLMKGFPDGTFKPNEPLTREQMAQVLYNLKKV